MKIISVVGARPQFIKAAIVSPLLRADNDEIIVHTGQHYDDNMSGMFFKQLAIPNPDYNLGISGGTHAEMTARMMTSLETVMIRERPDYLLLYGDTNSTLAAAITGAKLHIPIIHIEAGTRTHNLNNAEEINRICTDHVSSLLFACTENDMTEIEREGLLERAYLVGDVMYDAFLKFRGTLSVAEINALTIGNHKVRLPQEYYYLTCHREENAVTEKLREILCACEDLDSPVIYPVHPRNTKIVEALIEQEQFKNIIAIKPVGYFESICLTSNSRKVITDSGGVQREAFFAGKQCVTILDHVTWEATMVDNRNSLARAERNDILKKLSLTQNVDTLYLPFGNGQAAERIVRIINNLN